MSDSGDVDVALLKRAQRMNRAVMMIALGSALIVGFGALGMFLGSFAEGVRPSKGLGVVGGMTLASAFFATASVVWFVGRRLLIARLRALADEAVRDGRANRESLEHIIAMYAKTPRKHDDYDVR